MDRRFFLRVIEQNLKNIDEQFHMIRGKEGKIPQIELDIMMNNLRTLYEYFYQLEKVNREGPAVGPAPEKETEKERKTPDFTGKKEHRTPSGAKEKKEPPRAAWKGAHETEKPPAIGKDVSPDDIEPEKEKEERPAAGKPGIPARDISPDDVTLEGEEKKDALPENNEAAKESQAKKKGKNTADLFSEGSNTLADKLKSKDGTRVADKIQKSPVKNLRAAIGINEKFLLLNELFGGKMKDYEEAINRFESCPSLEESSRVLNSYKNQYNWSMESEAYQTFDNLLKRKYL